MVRENALLLLCVCDDMPCMKAGPGRNGGASHVQVALQNFPGSSPERSTRAGSYQPEGTPLHREVLPPLSLTPVPLIDAVSCLCCCRRLDSNEPPSCCTVLSTAILS